MMKNKELFKTKRQKKSNAKEKSTNVVIYTRVSTKEQYETNDSLTTQKRVCQEFAKRNGFTVMQSFGDTYESAKSDKNRKQFQEMLSFVRKHKKDLHGVIVYDFSRFSRSDENLVLVHELRKLGVEVLSATQDIDTQSPSGRLSRAVQLILANFDNEQKSDRTKAGIIEKLKQGIWSTKLPLGYVKNKSTNTVELDQKGILIKEAFRLIGAGDTISSIKRKMDRKGLKLDIRRWGDIFNNPFYAGLIVHRLLDYEPIKGVHPPVVSEELWKQIKQYRNDKELVQTYQYASDFYPLKGFISCSCGRKFTAYQAKKKSKPNGNFFYYKCNNPKCYTNISTKAAELSFINYLSNIKLNKGLEGVFKKQLKGTYLEYKNESIAKKRKLEQAIQEYDNKKRLLTDKYLYEGLEKELYEEHKTLLESSRASDVHELNLLQLELSNPVEFVDFSAYLAMNIDLLWNRGEMDIKKRLQNLVFPQGVSFDKQTQGYRTPETNIIFKLNNSLSNSNKHKKSGITNHNGDYSASVPWAGVEPARV